MEYSVDQVKDLYCKFTCKYGNKLIIINELEVDMCQHCQVNNFIRELRDYKKINE